jgi:hypothetical protein
MSLSLALATVLALAVQDGPMITARAAPTESADSVRQREAMAYAYPIPAGVPADDFGFLGYCDGLISGHVQLGETLGDGADAELMRLGRLERQDFQGARAVGAARATPAQVAVAQGAYDRAMTRWQPYLNNSSMDDRQTAFDLFFGLPGRCEHAARRVRANITTPPATLEEVGLTREEVLPPSLLEAEAEEAAVDAAEAAGDDTPAVPPTGD